jgi:hypothetical protein
VVVRASQETGIVTVEAQQQHDHVRIPSTSFAIQTVRPSVFNSGQAPGRGSIRCPARCSIPPDHNQKLQPNLFLLTQISFSPQKKKKSFSSHLHCFRNVFLLGLFLIMGILYIT